ncbi:MAG: hypothetical protein PHX51_02990 [Clostridia bacterium]|nr:hypothetical protein [Clostridia bacterium]
MKEPKTKSKGDKIAFIVGVVICAILLPIFIINLVMIFSSLSTNEPPSVFGVTPLAVETGSMQEPEEGVQDRNVRLITNDKGEQVYKFWEYDYELEGFEFIDAGDLIFVKECNVDELKLFDVIAFKEGQDNEDDDTYTVVIHMIVEYFYDDTTGEVVGYKTMGVNNQGIDSGYVLKTAVVGQYHGSRIAKMGTFVMFLQRPWGMIICIGVPVILFVVYILLTNRKEHVSAVNAKTQELEAELERLRMLAGNGNAGAQGSANASKTAEGESPADGNSKDADAPQPEEAEDKK